MRYLLLFLIGCLSVYQPLRAQPIGSWQEHLPYNQAISLAATENHLFTATPYSVFSISSGDQSIIRYNRITGLAETGVQTVFHHASNQLVIAYRNSNIDILNDGVVRNVNALRLKPINGDKTIYHIYGENDRCLLSTGFAIVVLNMVKPEIGDSWVVGNGGAYTKVNAVSSDGQYYYAATAQGLKRAPRSGLNLADYRNWEILSGTAGLPAGEVHKVLYAGGRLMVQQGPALYHLGSGVFEKIYEDDRNWNSLDYSGGKIYIGQQSGQEARLIELNTDGVGLQTITGGGLSDPRQALEFDGSLWVADARNGLLELNGREIVPVIPNSPAATGSGDIVAGNGEWWVATGNALSRFVSGTWTIYNSNDQTLPAGFGNIGPLLADRSGIFWAGSSGSGLLKKEQENFELLKAPLLSPALNDPNSFRVGGMAADGENRLWISNDGAENGLVVRLEGGDFRRFRVPFFYPELSLSQVLVDDANQKWIISPGGNGLFCFNHGAGIENTGDDQWKYYRAGQGNGNLPSNHVLSIMQDAFGFIWVGTNNGIGIVQCPSKVFSSRGCEAILPVVQTDNFAGYLFSGESVQAMALDGANRKWIGTRNGAWLISAGGEKTLQRFTTANSPLPDNDIRKIAIDPVTGTVIFSTAKGICSYKSDATEGSATNTNVIVYPNPVPPSYTGQIAIRGLVNNAMVKITEMNGRLVYQGRALGGQATWNGLDINGRKISTGVYLVFVTDDTRKEQAVTKIVFIQREP
ncbi:two-component regulator propeller domain-containing protein [Flavihumibacter stibioxidans]|uniref:PorZ N-terminal beta-propeller domain-containing protein n=1 Tax=Flavihumibacter stibioxidans TaxID=1834163 RepID=A0ABR7M9A3_9BACT|nr:two-component regulator propeller domain-containing protein [Flavihumibacter stibioxidans]MBC6491610.1 hypothetical protein [Flavihumibacter stibioxidans]